MGNISSQKKRREKKNNTKRVTGRTSIKRGAEQLAKSKSVPALTFAAWDLSEAGERGKEKRWEGIRRGVRGTFRLILEKEKSDAWKKKKKRTRKGVHGDFLRPYLEGGE